MFLGSSSMNAKTKGFLLLIITVLLSLFILSYVLSSDERLSSYYHSATERRTTNRKQPTSSFSGNLSRNVNTVVILWYNFPSYLKNFVQNFKRQKCQNEGVNCILSTDNSDLNRSSIVIFTHRTLPKTPPLKIASQVWVFNTLENKRFTVWPNSAWQNAFEWIMSYQRTVDISRPYGKIIRLDKSIERNYSEVFRQKKKFGVWMASHCPTPSRREKYIKELQKYIEIDTFGTCGKRKCGVHNPNMNECLRNFSRDYKFYFAFENSICTDYSTEKVFNLYAYNLSIIPVINGPPQASEYLPKETFLSTLDYTSPKSLAKKLKEIGSSERLYTQYLKEKDKYISLEQIEIFREAMCSTCEILNQLGGKKVSIKPKLKSVYGKGC